MGKKIKTGARRIMFAKSVYSPEAVKLAAYVFDGRADIKLYCGARGVEVEVISADRALAGEFSNEVLNQQCRLDLGPQNRKISNMIVTKALLSAAGEY